jgi:hypothetical protein
VLEGGMVRFLSFLLSPLHLSLHDVYDRSLLVYSLLQSTLTAAIPSATPSSSSASSSQTTALARTLRTHLDSLSDLRSSRARLLSAARTAVSQADCRDKVLRTAEGMNDEQKEAGLAAFEEMLREEMERLKEPYEREMERLEGRQADLVDEIKVRFPPFILLLPPLTLLFCSHRPPTPPSSPPAESLLNSSLSGNKPSDTSTTHTRSSLR